MPVRKGVASQMGARRKGGKKVMKKVSKRGAYKKNVKNQMVMRRAPMVETKQRVHSDIAVVNGYPAGAANLVNPLNWRTLVADDAFTNVPLRSWQRISHGFEDYQCVGNSIFSKFLNVKFQLRFPRGESIELPDPGKPGETYSVMNKFIEHPTKVYLVCGWITESMNYPIDNSPSPSLPAQSTATQDAIDSYITQQLKPFFDDDEDKLQFRPKQTTNIKIERYVNLAPKLNQAIATQAQAAKTWTTGGNPSYPDYSILPSGSIPDVMKSWNTKTNRKIPLTQGTETSFSTDKQNLYPNNSWIPFCVIYNPDYEAQANNNVADPNDPAKLSQTQMMEYRWNDAHYFTDS